MAVTSEGDSEVAFSLARPLFADTLPRWLEGGYDVASGGRFLTIELAEEGASEVVIVQNWSERLRH